MTVRAATVNVGERLPDLAFAGPDGALTDLRVRGRQATVVVLVHDAACEGCRAYLQELAASDAAHREWDGRVVVIAPAPADRVAASRGVADLPFAVLGDPDRRAWAALGIAGSAILIADQWGELHYVSVPAGDHSFLAPPEITDWLRFLAIRCPECEGEAR